MPLQRLLRPAVLVLVLLTAPSCAKAPPQLSPAGTAAFQATQVVRALSVLQDFAIGAEAQTPKLLSTDNTRKVVTYVGAAVKTIANVPGGWKPTVLAGLEQLRHDILPADWGRLLPYITLVQTLIGLAP
jgi:hypothetical protein